MNRITDRHGTLDLVLFTASYPYGPGEQFLENEIDVLAARFRNVIIIPRQIRGGRRTVPTGTIVKTGLAERHAARSTRLETIRTCGTAPEFFRELMARPVTLRQWAGFHRAAVFFHDAVRARRWISEWIRSAGVDLRETVFYTYWTQPETLALAKLKRKDPGVRLISRAHGGDLYEERAVPAYLPFRPPILRSIDRLFVISEHGRRYLSQKYPWASKRVEVSRLGVPDPKSTGPRPVADDVVRVVSCSFLSKVKRIDRLIRGLGRFARARKHEDVEWHHFGDGPLRPELRRLAAGVLPSNVTWTFHGTVPNRSILDYYRSNAIHAFVNVSSSEGIPVSIMEAQSFGIPVIATSVGGVPEIVDGTNGVRLPSDPTPEEIARALEAVSSGSTDAAGKREAAKQSWDRRYNAERNYRTFCDRIYEMFGAAAPGRRAAAPAESAP